MGGDRLIGVDVGTGSIKAVLFDRHGQIHGEAYRQTPVRQDGAGIEFPVQPLTEAAWSAIAELVGQAGDGDRIACIAFASIGESFIVHDAAGAPLDDIIAWHDLRAAEQARAVAERVGSRRLFALTGLDVEPIYSLCKLLWLRTHRPAVLEEAAGILFVADWLAFTLCGERATDLSLAVRSLLASPTTGGWSPEIGEMFEVHEPFLPPLRPSGTPLGPPTGPAREALGLGERCIVCVGGHDHIMGAMAAGAADPGRMVDSAGTAETIFRTGPRLVDGWPAGSLSFAQGGVWWLGDARPRSYLVGAMFESGGAIERFRAGLGGVHGWEDLVAQAEASPPLAVRYRPDAGVALKTDSGAWVEAVFSGAADDDHGGRFRALLEGLALESERLSTALTEHAGLSPVREIRLIGGLARNGLYARLKAAAFGAPIQVASFPEFTSLGAALAAGCGAGLYPSLDAAVAEVTLSWQTVPSSPDLVAAFDHLRAAYGKD